MRFSPRRYPVLCAVLGDEIVDPENRSLADEAYDRILLGIVRGDWSAGTELKSTRLAEELGMSRTPVIQALSRLAAEGIVEQTRNQRATLRPGAEDWLVDLHRVRQLLEPAAASTCAGRLPADLLGDLRQLHEDAKPGRGGDWKTAARWLDQALHLVIAEHCGNLAMREILRRCWSYKRISYEAGSDSEGHLRAGWRQHGALLEALAAGEGKAAADLMTEHLAHAVGGTQGRIV